MLTRGGGGQKSRKFGWRHLWMAPKVLGFVQWKLTIQADRPNIGVGYDPMLGQIWRYIRTAADKRKKIACHQFLNSFWGNYNILRVHQLIKIDTDALWSWELSSSIAKCLPKKYIIVRNAFNKLHLGLQNCPRASGPWAVLESLGRHLFKSPLEKGGILAHY